MTHSDQTPFSQQIAHLSRGMLDAELTEELAELIKAIIQHGKKGSITLTLNIKPELAQGEVVNVTVSPDVKTTKPSPERLSSRMYPTYDGDLLRNDPNQGELDLREIDTTPRHEAKEL